MAGVHASEGPVAQSLDALAPRSPALEQVRKPRAVLDDVVTGKEIPDDRVAGVRDHAHAVIGVAMRVNDGGCDPELVQRPAIVEEHIGLQGREAPGECGRDEVAERAGRSSVAIAPPTGSREASARDCDGGVERRTKRCGSSDVVPMHVRQHDQRQRLGGDLEAPKPAGDPDLGSWRRCVHEDVSNAAKQIDVGDTGAEPVHGGACGVCGGLRHGGLPILDVYSVHFTG